MISAPNLLARRLFAPIAPSYERWARMSSWDRMAAGGGEWSLALQ